MGNTENGILMIYYSLDGNTELVAQKVREQIGATLWRLEPDKEPPKTGLLKYLIGGKDALLKHFPTLVPCPYQLSDYDQVIVASPVWAGRYAPAIGAFLRDYKFQGKRVYLIACSSSGNAEKMLLSLEDDLIGNNVVETLSLQNPLRNKELEFPKLENFCHRIVGR